MIFHTIRASYASVQERFESGLIGLRCTQVEKYARDSWTFSFENKARINISCPWRIIANGRICLGSGDHAQMFGLSAPVDGQLEAAKLLTGKIVGIEIREPPADLILEFDNGVRLESFNNSGGYEGWQCSITGGLELIALGGGGLATTKEAGQN